MLQSEEFSKMSEVNSHTPQLKALNEQKLLPKRNYGIVINNGKQKSVVQASSTVLAEIKRLQSSTKLMFPRAPFGRLVKEIASKYGDFCFQSLAIEAIQEAAELFMVGFISDSYQLTRHRKRQTLGEQDMQLLYNLVVDLLPSLQPTGD